MRQWIRISLAVILAIGMMKGSTLNIFGAERVILGVSLQSDHQAQVGLKWSGVSQVPIMITGWDFMTNGDLVINYKTGTGLPTGFEKRTITHETYTFPCRIFLNEEGENPYPLSDVPDYEEDHGAIYNLYDRGIIGGYPDGSFGGNKTVTRAEFAKMLLLSADFDLETTIPTTYADVASALWSRPYIMTLSNKGILKGKGPGIFDPQGPISIGEVITVLTRTFQVYGQANAYPFELINHWSNEYFLEAVSSGLVQRSDAFYKPYTPDVKATRTQCARLLSRVLEGYYQIK